MCILDGDPVILAIFLSCLQRQVLVQIGKFDLMQSTQSHLSLTKTPHKSCYLYVSQIYFISQSDTTDP